jgi:Asp-tRNA(Asn)/Glu-tRNA(Gln) amidotransferase C subunit
MLAQLVNLACLKRSAQPSFYRIGIIIKVYGKVSKHVREEFDKTLGMIWSKQFEGLGQISRASFSEKRKANFLAEWNSTLQLMRQIQELVVLDENRPHWVKADVPKGVQIDQFLHAYYYTTVKAGQRSLHEEFHQRNKNNTQTALRDALKWWSQLNGAPNEEDTMMYERAPYLYEHLTSPTLSMLREEEFVEVCKRIHAFVTSARQTRNQEIGLPEDTHIDIWTRAEKVARWVWSQRTSTGATAIGMLHHVLYGGSIDDVTDRIWDAAFSASWHMPRFGLSCIGEIVGWAMPDRFPPRNGRTSKALYALGFDVTLYSE